MAIEEEEDTAPKENANQQMPVLSVCSRFIFIWKKIWKPLFCIYIPIMCSLILFWEGKDLGKPDPPQWMQARGAFVVLVMALYWITECLPLSVTALLPPIMFPLLQISSTEKIISSYLNSSVCLLLAGCIVALSFEYSNLHSRIALTVISLVGAQIPRLLFGTMITARGLAMMVPIVYVIMDEFAHGLKAEAIRAEEEAKMSTNPASWTPGPNPEQDEGEVNPDHSYVKFPVKNSRFGFESKTSVYQKIPKSDLNVNKMQTPQSYNAAAVTAAEAEKYSRKIKIMFLLGTAFGCCVGGTGVITGTGTNVIAQEEASKTAHDIEDGKIKVNDKSKCIEDLEITFVSWVQFNFVMTLCVTTSTWAVLLIYHTGIPHCLRVWRRLTIKERNEVAVKRRVAKNIELAIRAKLAQLGPISLHEIFVLTMFLCLVVLWASGGKVGWWSFFSIEGKLTPHDSVPAIFLVMCTFVMPKEKKYFKNFMQGGLTLGMQDPVMKWELVETKLAWGPLILIGGGSAISTGIKDSGLGFAIGKYLDSDLLKNLEAYQFLMIVLCLVCLLTTISSNTATAAILSPVLISLALSKGYDPKYMLMVPTVAASYAFLLPISTPPNAIVFDKSDMKQSEMFMPGVFVTIVNNALLLGIVHTVHELIYGFSSYDKACQQIP